MAAAEGAWSDLRTRLLSAAVLLFAALIGVTLGGVWFTLLVLVAVGLMVWELVPLFGSASPQLRVGLGALGAGSVAFLIYWQSEVAFGLLLAAPILVALRAGHDRIAGFFYTLAVLAAGAGLIFLRAEGWEPLVWLIAVVIASDVLGYFAGRMLGGPKFWPAVSPKKTWSGTIAGWVGAALVGVGFVLWCDAGWGLVALSAVTALAGQMGDIAESALKRRAGVKDSSRLIPGHGGVLDRFDAILGAALVWLVISGTPLAGVLP
jgi:phosphatidate cytidylyltransferase